MTATTFGRVRSASPSVTSSSSWRTAQSTPCRLPVPARVSGKVAFYGSRLPLCTPTCVLAGGASLEEIAEGWHTASPEVMARLLKFLCFLVDPEPDW